MNPITPDPVLFFRASCIAAAIVLLLAGPGMAAPSGGTPPAPEPVGFEQATAELDRLEGLFEVYLDRDRGRVLAALPAPSADGTLLRFLHALRLTRGLGSNPLGLDRGWGDAGRILRFRRVGERVLVEAENLDYRAEGAAERERSAVAESFARSFLWSTEVLAEDDSGRVLVDLSGWLVRDGLGLARRLGADGGSFKLADDRSMPDPGSLLVFPDNVEIDAWITFAGDDPGPQVRATAADPHSVTLVQHHSFVRLPDDGYRVRAADPRSGSFELAFRDYAAPLDAPIVRRYAVRHRLQYAEPGDPASGIVEPIVFHIDPGAPKRIRDALVDGASWWADAFEAAGFPDGYRVELLPEDAHPLDIRYNVVQWVHRQTRGWSYGGGVIDPRTGEMIKGHVILGSQRVRQDRMIFEGLAGVEATGTGREDDPVELSLDRIRQLAAHEVGHALGFGHNFAASSNDRASVMDYPAPWVDLRDGELDFSRAYGRGIGDWDRVTARWLYGEFPAGVDEAEALDAVLEDAFARGLRYVADEHGRDVAEAHPHASVWDNGSDPVEELRRTIAVRHHALQRFGPDRIAPGRPLAELREVLVPIYLYHRYQVDAAAKLIGGVAFRYAERDPVRERRNDVVEPVDGAAQQRALDALLETLAPDLLDLPDDLLARLPPGTRGFGFEDAPAETLAARTEPAFDPFTAAETAADLTLAALLAPRRAERLVRQHALDNELPGLEHVLDAIERRVVGALADRDGARGGLIAQRVAGRFAAALIHLDAPSASPEVRASSRAALESLLEALPRRTDPAFAAWLQGQVRGHLDRPAPPMDPAPPGPAVPPGSPIGSASGGWNGGVGTAPMRGEACWHCG
ncbi:zinc-dependent metalloprotease [Halomonas denitrificans]|nr:zinc-dependent metalloprotease [Halomonas denitrificans]